MTRNGGAPVLPCTEGDVLMSPRPSGFATSTFIGGCCACRPLAQPYVEGGCQGGGDAAAGDGADRRAARSAVRLILLQSSSAVSRRSIMVLVSTLTSTMLHIYNISRAWPRPPASGMSFIGAEFHRRRPRRSRAWLRPPTLRSAAYMQH